MTALRPIESRKVRAVASEKYPSNLVCAHPECKELVTLRPSGEPTVHHTFSRSKIKSSSYFVDVEGHGVIPHAVGLCGSGTTGHHGDVEEQRARIQYDLETKVWTWWDRDHEVKNVPAEGLRDEPVWRLAGELNPRPGSVEGKPKKKKHLGKAARTAKTWTIKAPVDAEEDMIGQIKDAVEAVEEKMRPGQDHRPPAWTILDSLLYTLTNIDETDV